jgi:hypothetical protein
LDFSIGFDGSVKRDWWSCLEEWIAKSSGIVGLLKRDGSPRIKRERVAKNSTTEKKKTDILKSSE